MFVLVLYTSSFIFQPKSFTMITFETKVACEQALVEAKKQWPTINDLTKCLDLEKEAAIREKQNEIENLRGDK